LRDKDINWVIKKQIGIGVGRGLVYLHSQNVIHADLRTVNILVTDDNIAKIADFGNSSNTSNPKEIAWNRWMDPELTNEGMVYSKSSDIYCFGLVLWELGSKKNPYENYGEGQVHIALKIEKNIITKDTPSDVKMAIEYCWRAIEYRPTIMEVLKILQEDPLV